MVARIFFLWNNHFFRFRVTRPRWGAVGVKIWLCNDCHRPKNCVMYDHEQVARPNFPAKSCAESCNGCARPRDRALYKQVLRRGFIVFSMSIFVISMKHISKTRERVSSNTEKRVENTARSIVFSTNFEVFGNVMKHSLECLVYFLNRN